MNRFRVNDKVTVTKLVKVCQGLELITFKPGTELRVLDTSRGLITVTFWGVNYGRYHFFPGDLVQAPASPACQCGANDNWWDAPSHSCEICNPAPRPVIDVIEPSDLLD